MPTFSFACPHFQGKITSHGALFRSQNFVENNVYGIPDAEREIFALQSDGAPEIGSGGGIEGYQQKYAARVRGLSNSKQGYAGLFVDKGHYAMLDGFVQAIMNDTASPCDEIAGYLATYLARLAIRSIETRQSLPVPIDRVAPAMQQFQLPAPLVVLSQIRP